MRHQKTRHKLSRSASHRKALLANLCIEVIDHERIKTTEAKAKAVKPEIEKLITLARKGDLHARRQATSILQHPDKGVIYKLFEEIAPRYAERPGGYTRILKLGPRSSDATEMVYSWNGAHLTARLGSRVRRRPVRGVGRPAGAADGRGRADARAAHGAAGARSRWWWRAGPTRRPRARAGGLVRGPCCRACGR